MELLIVGIAAGAAIGALIAFVTRPKCVGCMQEVKVSSRSFYAVGNSPKRDSHKPPPKRTPIEPDPDLIQVTRRGGLT